MTAAPADDEDWDDLLPDDLAPPKPVSKGLAKPVVRSPAQKAAMEKRAAEQVIDATARNEAQRLAQIVNLTIAGYSLAEIGLQIGATAAEVDRMINADSARYVRNQPALRIFVRNWVSKHFAEMIEVDYKIATDPKHPEILDYQDRVNRMLVNMAKLHGAEAPTQSEVKVDAAPEAVEKMVAALAAGRNKGYDEDVFDIIDADVVEDAVTQTEAALEVSGNAVEQPQEGDDLDF